MPATQVKVTKVDTSDVRVVGSDGHCGVCGGSSPTKPRRKWGQGIEMLEVHTCSGCAREEDRQKAWPVAEIAFWPEED